MPPFLPDDLLTEILLRLPPRPSSLLRASLVCKHWRSLVTDPRFIRRLDAASVLLGVFFNDLPFPSFIPAGDPPDRIPASRFHRPAGKNRGWLIRDCRRGRALLQNCQDLLVWDPLSPEKPHLVPHPPTSVCDRFFYGFGAVLLREDDGGSFRVAIALVDTGTARASVYSSETGSWGHPVTASPTSRCGRVPWKDQKPGAVVGDTVYWLLNDDRVLSLELHTTGGGGGLPVLTVLEPKNVPTVHAQNVQLMTTPDGKLGLASVTASAMRLWTLEIDGHNATSWTLRRTVLLDAVLLPRPPPVRRRRQRHPDHIVGAVGLTLALVLDQHDDNSDSTPCTVRIVGVHEDGSTVFLKNGHVLFMLQLEPTLHIKKMDEMFVVKHGFATVYPYASILL